MPRRPSGSDLDGLKASFTASDPVKDAFSPADHLLTVNSLVTLASFSGLRT
ncbi:hypothetical protein ACXIZN_09120 [Amycolatopsis sp. TRM77291]